MTFPDHHGNDPNKTDIGRSQPASVGEVEPCSVCGEPADWISPTGHRGCGRCRDEYATDEGTGAALLDEVESWLNIFVVFPNHHVVIAFALWIVATHAQPAWEHATRFVLKSPIKRCGKTRALEVARELVHAPLSTTNISPAALVRSINEANPPTLILDEADTIFGSKRVRPEGAEDLRGILNSGHSRGWPYIRWDVRTRQREECPTFAMALIAGIGDLPDTIEDRGVVGTMQRRAASEKVAQFRRRTVVPQLNELRVRLGSWMSTHSEELSNAIPDMPVEDRAADTWEPLVAVADLAGGRWPEIARQACVALCAEVETDEATAGERLLADLAGSWKREEPYLSTAIILDRLRADDEAPWDDWHGQGLGPRGLAGLLKPYGIKSRTVRPVAAEKTARGYSRADLIPVWERYTHAPDTAETDDIPLQRAMSEGVSPPTGLSDTETTRTNPQPAVAKTGALGVVSEVSPTGVPTAFERAEMNMKSGGLSRYPDPDQPGVYAGDRCRCGNRLDHYTRDGFPYCDKCGPQVAGDITNPTPSRPFTNDPKGV